MSLVISLCAQVLLTTSVSSRVIGKEEGKKGVDVVVCVCVVIMVVPPTPSLDM